MASLGINTWANTVSYKIIIFVGIIVISLSEMEDALNFTIINCAMKFKTELRNKQH